MKKLEKYKIAPQVKFVKFKVKHFAEIPTIRHDKAVPPSRLRKIISRPECVPTLALEVQQLPPPAWLMTQKSSPPDPRGRTLCKHAVNFQNFGVNQYGRKQPPEVFCKKRCFQRFRKIYRKTPLPQSLFLIKLQLY